MSFASEFPIYSSKESLVASDFGFLVFELVGINFVNLVEIILDVIISDRINKTIDNNFRSFNDTVVVGVNKIELLKIIKLIEFDR